MSNELRIKALAVVQEYTEMGNRIFNTSMAVPTITFKLKGACGGQYSSRTHEVRVNMVLFAENVEHYADTTIPHEVAHAFQRHLYSSSSMGRRVMPHGQEWKRIMVRLGKSPKRCHTYDTSNSSKKTVAKSFEYRCNCKSFMFTIIRHRRAQKAEAQGIGGCYRCPKCKGNLKYAGATPDSPLRPIRPIFA